MPSRVKQKTPRRYASALRRDQTEATRRRIVEAFLAQGRAGASDVSFPELAKYAAVSIPTVYRHFPTRADLFQATVAHADALVPTPTDVDFSEGNLGPALEAVFEHRNQVADLLGPVGNSPLVWDIRREVTVPRRRAYMERLIDQWVPGITDADRRSLSDILVVLVSASTASAFRGYCGNSSGETAERVQWLLESVIKDARTRAKVRKKEGRRRQ
ncbi:MAG: TetR/AcrR family transcriptional regulator [Vicinamibacterales bacterium]